MKMFLLLGSLALSTSAMANTLPDLSGLTITPATELTAQLSKVQVNGAHYQVTPSAVDVNGKTVLKASVIPGEEVYDETGFNSYTVTGEIIVKLNKEVDFSQFNQDNDLIITQAYQSFYVLKSVSNKDMLPLVDALKQLDGVTSVTLELAQKGVIAK